MQHIEVLTKTFPGRIKAVECLVDAIQPRANNAEQFRDVANQIDRAGPYYHRAPTGATYSAFATLLRTLAQLVDWRAAVLGAKPDAAALLLSAKDLHKLWLNEYSSSAPAKELITASEGISSITDIDGVAEVCRRLAGTPLPISIFADELRVVSARLQAEREKPEESAPPELSIAFLKFFVDGAPAHETHSLTPEEIHDLDIEVRVTRWPDAATALTLTPVTIEPRSTYEIPTFQLPRPSGDPPYRLEQRGRVVLRVPQALMARPFEFRYTAEFTPVSAEKPVSVVGQRTLRVEAYDFAQTPITGYESVDRKLIRIRDHLRPLISGSDLDSLLILLKPLGNLAGRSVQDALFKDSTREADFQDDLRGELRRDPAIGSSLEEHPRSTGGVTDLSFRGIRIELKYENASPLSIQDCQQFTGQMISYAVGNGKRVGVLCVLDNSKKRAPPFPAENGIEVLHHSDANNPVQVVTVLIQGNLALPSDLSR